MKKFGTLFPDYLYISILAGRGFVRHPEPSGSTFWSAPPVVTGITSQAKRRVLIKGGLARMTFSGLF